MATPTDLQRFERDFRERELDFAGDARVRHERRVEFDAVVRRARARPGLRVLDAGCGIGRISEALARRGAQVTALDFAHARLRALEARIPGGVDLVQGDVTRLPLAQRSFDLIVSTQVIEHVPEEGARRALLAAFHRLLRPDGRVLLTAYNYSLPWQRRGGAREGLHNTGIFYHCYTASELKRELQAAGFTVRELCGLIHLWPHTYRTLPRLGTLGRGLDHCGEHFARQGERWGHLLLAQATISNGFGATQTSQDHGADGRAQRRT